MRRSPVDVITQAELKKLVRYDPENGGLYWTVRRGTRGVEGARIGSPDRRGYRHCVIDGVQYWEHQLVFLFLYGRFPAGVTDHDNGVEAGNTEGNLRDVSQSENSRNMRRSVRNTSGVVGVYYAKAERRVKRRCACVRIGGVSKHLGSYATIKEATAARAAADVTYGFNPNHGKRPPRET